MRKGPVVEPLEVLLFGGLHLRRGGETVPPIPSRVARSLFAYLVVNRGVAHPRERLATQFWPDLPDTRARRRLSHTLWQIQDTLGELPGDVGYLDVRADTIGFSREVPCWVDTEEFTRRLDELRARASSGAARARDLADLEQAIELYRGDFLAGHYEQWVVAEQERLEQRYLEALTWLVSLAKSQGAYADALTYARRLTNLDPLREDAHQEVMRLSMLLGRAAEAIRQYGRLTEVLAEELGTQPSAATVQLYERILRQRDAVETRPEAPAATPFPERLPLLGRERERSQIVTVLERALAGRSGAVLIEGDAGAGKSRLLTETVDDASWRGFATVRITCHGPEAQTPFGVVTDLLDDVLTPLRVEQLRPRVERVWLAQAALIAPVLARALPADHPPAPPLRDEEGAQRMRDALARVLAALASADPLLVAVDDLQWADLESLEVLERLAGFGSGARGVLAVAYRGDDARARPDVWASIRELDRRAQPVRLVLGPLDAFSTAELARLVAQGRPVDPAAASRLQRETGGNPLFVVETLRELADADRLDALAGGEPDDLPLPGSIRELVSARLERLDPEAREVLQVVALGGDGTDLDTLATATDLPRQVVVDATDTLLRRSLVREAAGGYGLHHEQIRRVVIARLGDREPAALHRRLARALEQHHPHAVERLAYHHERAGEPRRAAELHTASARNAAAVHAYRTADAAYRRARELLGTGPASTTTMFDLVAEHADVLAVLGDRAQEREAIDELGALAAGDPRRESDAARRRALLLAHLGELGEAVVHARRAVTLARRVGDPGLTGLALVALGTALTWSGHGADAVDILRDAAGAASSPGVRAEVLTMLGTVLRELQRYDEAVEHLVQALEVARDDGQAREEARALGVLGAVRMETGRSTEAAELYTQAIERCLELGFRHGEALNRLNHANVRYVRGELGPALGEYAAAGRIFADLGDQRGEAMVRLNLGFVRHAVLGDDAQATDDIRVAIGYFEDLGDERFVAQCLDTLASIELRAGSWERAREHIERAVDAVTRVGDAWVGTQLLHRRAELALAEGSTEAALADVRAALDAVLEHGMADLEPAIRALEGTVRLALDDTDGAISATAEAVAALHPGVERAYLVHREHHRALAAAGRHDEAGQAAAAAARALEEVLATLDGEARRQSRSVPEHLEILATAAVADAVVHPITSASAPHGRPLRDEHRVPVVIDLDPGPDAPEDPVARRRWLLVRVVEQARGQGADPSIAELAAVLGVSQATVRRDLAALRRAGHQVPTRGHRAV